MISLLYAHPYAHHARLEQMMLNAVQHWPGLELRELYQLYPDFYINVALERKMLQSSAAIVLHYPMQCGLPPALLVQYLHKVFQYGWAYGTNDAGDAVMSLQGKSFWLVTHAVASHHELDPCYQQSMFTPLRQLALSCGMRWQQPLMLPELTDATVATQAAELFRHGLEQLTLTKDDRDPHAS
ncbi:MAG: NAD(P)H-dependent oxidoreductase [Gammaproteobacteria bacterium]|nr:NAD(P)H-dependent oxidoreductase [Gammaproteobacteria bacterium]MBU2059984.1 NAD(P)H-dependent oxidoreductase [Gammaproteobacteria bacterium]MBU2174143.1 NAD(P)H-dependent oxidoreductase [Gammaproteobacteria bacterium]MBU2248386.1 NAD(P)H-dependent oxidoreductase [Gammaproteobacteria bacterium]MBU2343908.1 NAD(P)H-dependent oxidoreductase [Gammaproteobacteria bacterium]